MNWMNTLAAAAKQAPAKAAPAEHPMIVALLQAASAFEKRSDSFAQGKAETCRDIALKLARFGDFASDKQREFADKLVAWSKPRQEARSDAPTSAAGVAVPRLFAVLQNHATFHAGQLKISRKNGDSLCWLVWGTVCVGKIENGTAILFAGRMAKLPLVEGMTVEANVVATLQEFERDPLKTAMAYGKLSGRCCSCGRDLTDPTSIANGIGPICAQKFA